MITTTLRKPCGGPPLAWPTKGVPHSHTFLLFLQQMGVFSLSKMLQPIPSTGNGFPGDPFPKCSVRMAERSKALRSGRSLVLQAWVRIPLLTKRFPGNHTVKSLGCNTQNVTQIESSDVRIHRKNGKLPKESPLP